MTRAMLRASDASHPRARSWCGACRTLPRSSFSLLRSVREQDLADCDHIIRSFAEVAGGPQISFSAFEREGLGNTASLGAVLRSSESVTARQAALLGGTAFETAFQDSRKS